MSPEPFHVEGVDVNEEPPALPPQPIYETAFYVFVDPNGHWMVSPDVHSVAHLQIKRQATPHDYYAAACTIEKDVISWETAAKTAAQIQAMTNRPPEDTNT